MGPPVMWEEGVCIYGTLEVPNNDPYTLMLLAPMKRGKYFKLALWEMNSCWDDSFKTLYTNKCLIFFCFCSCFYILLEQQLNYFCQCGSVFLIFQHLETMFILNNLLSVDRPKNFLFDKGYFLYIGTVRNMCFLC